MEKRKGLCPKCGAKDVQASVEILLPGTNPFGISAIPSCTCDSTDKTY